MKDYNYLYEVIISKIPTTMSQEDLYKIKEFTRNFVKNLLNRWKDASRVMKTFIYRENNKEWLGKNIKWPVCTSVDLLTVMGIPDDVADEMEDDQDPIPSVSTDVTICTAEAGTSTETEKRKPFADLSPRQKYNRCQSLLVDINEEEMLHLLTSKLRANRKIALAKVIEHLNKNPDHIPNVTDLLFNVNKKAENVSEDKTLALYTSLGLSKWQYKELRTFIHEERCSVSLPSYKKLTEAKKRCYPSEEDIEITENKTCIRYI